VEDTKRAGEQGECKTNLHICQNEIRSYITKNIHIYITSLMKKTKVHITLQSLPQYQVFSKPKEQGKNPKIKTCTHHRCGDTTKRLLHQKPGRRKPAEKGESKGRKGKGKEKYGRRELRVNQRADTLGSRQHTASNRNGHQKSPLE
jgi:hypothetical protein